VKGYEDMNLEEAYDTHIDTVYKFFYIHCFDRELAEDLTSDTFLKFAERYSYSADSINDTKKFIYGIMRNVWLMHLREKYQRAETSLDEIGDFDRYVEKTVDDYSGTSLRDRAVPFIERLPEQQQKIVYMRLINERSLKDIASDIGKDNNYVKTTYKRGVKNLRTMLELSGEPKEVL
jgi:RNA polymerase sigma-70 factor (ECF subfamily)